MRKAREYTCKIIELVDEGVLDRDTLIRNLLMWFSEAEVEDFYHDVLSEMVDPFEEEDDELDGPDEQRAWYDTSAELM